MNPDSVSHEHGEEVTRNLSFKDPVVRVVELLRMVCARIGTCAVVGLSALPMVPDIDGFRPDVLPIPDPLPPPVKLPDSWRGTVLALR